MKRYFVEYLDCEAGEKLIRARGGDPDYTWWEVIEQWEIEVSRRFDTKRKAVAWAMSHRVFDVFNMPRIVERTLVVHSSDERGRPLQVWEKTGYWEADGRESIVE